MRHEQRQPPEGGDVGGHQHVDDAGPAPRLRRIDADDTRVGVRATMDRDVQHTWQRHVGDVSSPPRDQPRVLASAHPRAEQALAHPVPPQAPRRAMYNEFAGSTRSKSCTSSKPASRSIRVATWWPHAVPRPGPPAASDTLMQCIVLIV